MTMTIRSPQTFCKHFSISSSTIHHRNTSVPSSPSTRSTKPGPPQHKTGGQTTHTTVMTTTAGHSRRHGNKTGGHGTASNNGKVGKRTQNKNHNCQSQVLRNFVTVNGPSHQTCFTYKHSSIASPLVKSLKATPCTSQPNSSCRNSRL